MSGLSEKTASQLLELFREKKDSPEEVISDVKNAIKSKDRDGRKIHAYIDSENARPIKHEGTKGPLSGVPIAIKDNICVESQEATCASKILKNFVAPYHATVIEKLLNAGAVIYGRTNMDEFAFGSSCETSCYGPTRNPRDPERVPGGSSGGSAACVVDHTAIAALGSDTGGSIRQPAAFCGIVGMKPTYGRVSRYGLIAFASSLDQIGPLTKDVRDNALLLNVIAGYDPKDSTSANVPVPDYLRALESRDLKGLKIGFPIEMQKDLTPDAAKVMQEALRVLKKKGAVIDRTITLPHTRYAVNVYYIVAPSEASSNLARFDGVRFGFRDPSVENIFDLYEKSRGEGFGAEAKRRIILGTYCLSSGYYDAYYLKAMKVRTLIKNDFDTAFQKVDVIMMPTAPSAAFKVGEKIQDPLEMYLSDIYTISANLAGVPAISLPGALSSDHKLPLGLQFAGKPFGEETLYKIAYAFEQETGLHKTLGNVR